MWRCNDNENVLSQLLFLEEPYAHAPSGIKEQHFEKIWKVTSPFGRCTFHMNPQAGHESWVHSTIQQSGLATRNILFKRWIIGISTEISNQPCLIVRCSRLSISEHVGKPLRKNRTQCTRRGDDCPKKRTSNLLPTGYPNIFATDFARGFFSMSSSKGCRKTVPSMGPKFLQAGLGYFVYLFVSNKNYGSIFVQLYKVSG